MYVHIQRSNSNQPKQFENSSAVWESLNYSFRKHKFEWNPFSNFWFSKHNPGTYWLYLVYVLDIIFVQTSLVLSVSSLSENRIGSYQGMYSVFTCIKRGSETGKTDVNKGAFTANTEEFFRFYYRHINGTKYCDVRTKWAEWLCLKTSCEMGQKPRDVQSFQSMGEGIRWFTHDRSYASCKPKFKIVKAKNASVYIFLACMCFFFFFFCFFFLNSYHYTPHKLCLWGYTVFTLSVRDVLVFQHLEKAITEFHKIWQTHWYPQDEHL